MVKHEPGTLPLAEFQTIEDVLVGLRERGGRATHARRLLLGALFADRQHHSAEELAEEVQAKAPDVNISTIYRNLDELVRLGVVDRSHLGGGPAAYHLASATHGHLVCEQCGAMTEVPGELFRDVTETLAHRYGFTASPHRFSIIGRCADCAYDASRLRTPPGGPQPTPGARWSRPPTAGRNHGAAPASSPPDGRGRVPARSLSPIRADSGERSRIYCKAVAAAALWQCDRKSGGGWKAMRQVSRDREEIIAGVLPPALEVMTAFTQSRDDPSFFWRAVERVMGEPLAGGDPAEALAGLTLGLSALSGILLEQVAEVTGRDQLQVLAEIHRSYLAG